jgi:hypothetical protein
MAEAALEADTGKVATTKAAQGAAALKANEEGAGAANLTQGDAAERAAAEGNEVCYRNCRLSVYWMLAVVYCWATFLQGLFDTYGGKLVGGSLQSVLDGTASPPR